MDSYRNRQDEDKQQLYEILRNFELFVHDSKKVLLGAVINDIIYLKNNITSLKIDAKQEREDSETDFLVLSELELIDVDCNRMIAILNDIGFQLFGIKENFANFKETYFSDRLKILLNAKKLTFEKSSNDFQARINDVNCILNGTYDLKEEHKESTKASLNTFTEACKKAKDDLSKIYQNAEEEAYMKQQQLDLRQNFEALRYLDHLSFYINFSDMMKKTIDDL